jgi:hypothetical protein
MKIKILFKTAMIALLSLFFLSCAARQSIKKTEAFWQNQLSKQEVSKISIPDSAHENKKGYGRYKLQSGHEMEYLKIGHQGEIIIFICGILDDSIVTFSNMPVLIDKAEKGLCQLYFINLPGNGYSSIPNKYYFNPIYLKLCLEEFLRAKGLKEFSVVGNSNGCTVSMLLLSSNSYGKDFKIKNFWGFNPLLKKFHFGKWINIKNYW